MAMVTVKGKGPAVCSVDLPKKSRIHVPKIKVYESKNRPKMEAVSYFDRFRGECFREEEARDFHCGDKSREEIEAILPQAFECFSPQWGISTVEEFGDFSIRQFAGLAQGTFAKGEMDTVIEKMVYHMRDGNGAEFQDATLTQKVSEHKNTKRFVGDVKKALETQIEKVYGDINRLCWDLKSNYFSEALYGDMQSNTGKLTFKEDTFTGLRIAINDTWGYEIWLEDYDFNGTSFTSTMYIDLYDHFGLDDADVQKITTSWGPFVPWFTLQRWEGFNKKFKPFVTRLPLRIPFKGIVLF